jgi:hypothetical protein
MSLIANLEQGDRQFMTKNGYQAIRVASHDVVNCRKYPGLDLFQTLAARRVMLPGVVLPAGNLLRPAGVNLADQNSLPFSLIDFAQARIKLNRQTNLPGQGFSGLPGAGQIAAVDGLKTQGSQTPGRSPGLLAAALG